MKTRLVSIIVLILITLNILGCAKGPANTYSYKNYFISVYSTKKGCDVALRLGKETERGVVDFYTATEKQLVAEDQKYNYGGNYVLTIKNTFPALIITYKTEKHKDSGTTEYEIISITEAQ